MTKVQKLSEDVKKNKEIMMPNKGVKARGRNMYIYYILKHIQYMYTHI